MGTRETGCYFYAVFSVPQTIKNGTSPDTTGTTSEDERNETMKKEELIAKGLTEEQATAVIDIYTNEMKGFSPKSRFDELNTAKAES